MVQGIGEGLGELLRIIPWVILGVGLIAFVAGWVVGGWLM